VERVSLSPDGPEVSRLVWGAWRLADDPTLADGAAASVRGVRHIIDRCLELGITTVDHADIYGGYRCETLFGNALREAPGLRHRLELITKCGVCLTDDARPDTLVKHYDSTAGHITASVERSLVNLATDTLDLLLIHRPDPMMDPDDTAAALRGLREAGKIRHAGVSNCTPAQFELLQSRLDFPLVTNQIEVSPLHLAPFTDGTLDDCLRRRLRPMAWSPMAGGRLLRGSDADAQRVRAALHRVAQRHERAGVDQVALAWLLRHPSHMVPLIGTVKVGRITAAVGALDLALDRQSWFEIYEAGLGHEVP
jgi:predicted oxidoreductase